MNGNEARLKDVRDRFVALVENSQEFIALADPDGTVLYVNAAGKRLIGLPPDDDYDVTATRMADYVPEDRVAEAGAHLRTTLRHGRWSGEFEYRHFQTGERLPVFTNAFVLRGTDGKIVLAQVTRDLREAKAVEAEQRAAQAALVVRERQYRELADAIPQIVWSSASNEFPRYYNRRWYEYTGISAGDSQAEDWLQVVHPDDVEHASTVWSEIRRTGIPVSLDARLRAATGGYRWHLITVQIVRDDVGEIAKLIGIATDIEDRRRAEERLHVLAEASRRLSESLDLTVTLRTLLELIVPSSAECAFVSLADAENDVERLVAAYHAEPAKSARLNEYVGAPPYRAAALAELDSGSVVSVPFVGSGALRGSLHVVRGKTSVPFGEADGVFFEELAQRATIAITNARLYEHEVRVANALQRASLPATLPSMGDVQFSGHYVPGASEAQIGGDWYDAMRLSDGRFLISIGDVTGSGLAAGVIMGNLRQIIRGVAQIVVDPKLMLDAADRALRAEYPDCIATIFVAVYDPLTSTLTYTSAGHPPAFLVTCHRVSALATVGLPLGLRDVGEPEPVTVRVPPETHLVAYTDGLIEASRDVIEGERLLVEELEKGTVFGASDPSRALVERLLPGGTHDDVAVLIVRLSNEDAALRCPAWSFDARDAHESGSGFG